MKNPFIFLLSAIILSLPLSMNAQQIFGTHLQYNHQLGSLQDKGFEHGGGISADFFTYSILHPESTLKLQPGVRFDIAWNGGANTPAVAIERNTGEEYNISVGNMNTGLYGALRISQEAGEWFSVYADGLIGARAFISSEQGSNPASNNSCPKLDLEVLNSSFTPSFGGSMGFVVDFSSDVSLDMRATYIRNGRVSFVDLNSVEPGKGDEQAYVYTVRNTRASQLMFQLGIQMKLGCW